MAIIKKTVVPKAARPAPTVETRESTETQVAALLQADDEAQKITKGVNGQVYGPSRRIITNKKH